MACTTGTTFQTDEVRWEAIRRRDRRADGQFLYSVKTTGVYCRPACPSRLPNRRNIVFFATREEAERAGYRPCKRCNPAVPSVEDRQVRSVARACALIERAEQPPALKDLAAAVGLSRFHLHRLFKAIVGVTPREYAAARRARRLAEQLERGAPVTRAIYGSGFGSTSRVYEKAGSLLGMTPSRFRTGAAGMRIRFTVTRSWLGWLLVAATDRGICAIEFGDAPRELRERLEARFPKAALEEGGAELRAWVAEVTALVGAPGRGLSLPLDVHGTAFQQRVWKALQRIPPGATASYGEVATMIGRPGAARAVARACRSNPVAVAIPCHRVVRGDGQLSGYRWGTDRKRALLARERAIGSALSPERAGGDE